MGKDDGLHRETKEPYWKRRRRNNPDGIRRAAKTHYFKSTYGISLEEYSTLVEQQDSRCAICQGYLDPEAKSTGALGFKVDHCHQSGKVRGLLCHKCNIGLGHFQDSAVLLERAKVYLKTAENTLPVIRASDITEVLPDKYKDSSKIKIRKNAILLSGDAAFYTLQGEGPTLGHPCVFIRLHHCNLHCTYCDAYYTWKRNAREFWTEPQALSLQECCALIEKTRQDPRVKRVIWTGGEPLIQKQQIEAVAKMLPNWAHEIETNGTLMPTVYQLKYFQFNCSPKLRNNEADREHARIKPKILGALNEVNTTFKFVCRAPDDLKEIEQKYLPHISREKIIIMPEGVTEDEITYHARVLCPAILERGWKMTPRFQAIFADGARRGV